jgi:allantoin racemase
MRLLLINANTSTGVTELCAQAARTIASPATEIVPLTGRFGARIIESRAESAIAVHAMLELVAEHATTADAALVAVSYDTGLKEARDIVGFPVIGITQASLALATLIGSRVGMITFGTPWIYRELAQSYGAADRIAAIEVVQASAKEAYENPNTVSQLVRAAISRLVDDAGADVIVLCGAAFAGMAALFEKDVPVPVLDGVTCGVPLCETLVALKARRIPGGGGRNGAVGLSQALQDALYRT